jgi:hypothetical protein
MSLAKETAKCPYCKEPIAAGAIRCKHCHADLVKRDDKKGSRFAKYNTFRIGFLCGIIFAIVIFVLGYIQFFWGD